MSDNKINTSSPTDLVRRLNTRFAENPFWSSLFTAASKVINEYVTRPRNQLATLRDPKMYRRGDHVTLNTGERAVINHVSIKEDAVTVHAQVLENGALVEFDIDSPYKERAINIAGCRLHGFHYFSDKLTDADYARIHEWVERYWPESGTPQFIRFIGFVKNMDLQIDHLLSDETVQPFESERATTDGVNFTTSGIVGTVEDYYPYLEAEADAPKVQEGGKAYLTSHVQLRYDAIRHPVIDFADLFFLFYYLAPIHLVLERIVSEVRTELPPIERAHGLFLNLHAGATLDWKPAAEIRTKTAAAGQVSLHASAFFDYSNQP